MEATDLQGSVKMGMTECRKEFEDKQMMRKKKKVDCSAFLTDDDLLEILKRLPADILRYKCRFVCRRWFHVITNRILVEHASFFVHQSSVFDIVRHVVREEKQGLKLEVQHLRIPIMGEIKSCCNEFLLITDFFYTEESLYIFNLISQEGIYLPRCSTSCRPGYFHDECGVALSFDGIKGVYKVVHVFMGPPIECKILVLDKEVTSHVCSKWKKVEVPSYMGKGKYYWDNPVSVKGRYFHWDVHCSKHLVSVDMVKEKFFQTCLPGSDDERMTNQYSLFEMDGFLTLIRTVSLEQANIWILRDFLRMKWEKLQSISFSIILSPATVPAVRSVIRKRYLIFRKPINGLFSYDLKTKHIKDLDIDVGASDRWVVHSTAPSFL